MDPTEKSLVILESLSLEIFTEHLLSFVLTGETSRHYGDFSLLAHPNHFARLRNTAKQILRNTVQNKGIDTSEPEIRLRMRLLHDYMAKATNTNSHMGRSALR